MADAKGIKDAKAKDALGAATREGKRRGLTHSDLMAAWGVRLTADEKVAIAQVGSERRPGKRQTSMTAKQALDDACEKLFAKDSVVPSKRLVAQALRYGFGQVTPEMAWQEFERRGMIVRQVGGESLCTTLDVLGEEVSLINFVRSGLDTCPPLVTGELDFGDSKLSAEQRAAVRHLLTSRDQVTGLRGSAGAGKTTSMQDVVAHIESLGIRVFAFAQSASASRGTLRNSGFIGAETIARLLVDTKLQERVRGQVILIDEAGLVGVPDLWKVMQLAGDSTKIFLTGDTAQHAPVARGDGFRLLQDYAGLKVAHISQIRRQEGEVYRKAVAAFSRGDLRNGFRRLDQLGAIVEISDETERYRLLAAEFIALSRKDSVPLVVSPTHAEAAKVTAAIREAKREAGRLGEERPFIRLHNLQWEEVERRRPENYEAGLVVQFHQNAVGIRRGDQLRIVSHPGGGTVLAENSAGQKIAVPLDQAAKFHVFEQREVKLARGDRLRLTHGGKSEDGRRLNNGDVFTIEKFSRDGKIVLDSGAVLDPKKGLHATLGYVSTSHSAQSKTVRDVLVAQNGDSFLASSQEQFYVSVSRGKQSIRIYTDDREALQQAVGKSSKRQAGVELAGLTAKDVSSLMGTELNGRQWREQIQSRRAEGASKSHVQNLLKERRQDGLKKPESIDFRQYLEMRRGMAGADGKSRAKVYSGGDDLKKASTRNRSGKSFLRPTEPPTPQKAATESLTAAKGAARAEAKVATVVPARQSRIADGVVAARENFKRVSERVKGAFQSADAQKRANQFPHSTPEQVAKHSVNQKAADAAVTKAKTQVQQKTAAPVIRRGGK